MFISQIENKWRRETESCVYLERNVIVLWINGANLGHVLWILRLQKMYPNPIIKQPANSSHL